MSTTISKKTQGRLLMFPTAVIAIFCIVGIVFLMIKNEPIVTCGIFIFSITILLFWNGLKLVGDAQDEEKIQV